MSARDGDGGDDGAADSGPKGAYRTYKLVSASFRGKNYADGLLLVDEASNEMELRQLTGRWKKEETPVARFRIEPTAEVLVDGPLLRVSELSIALESPSVAEEIAEILRRPARRLEAARLLSEAESAIRDFVETRKEAMTFLSALRANPRDALLSAESMWTEDSNEEPLEAVFSSYSGRIGVSLEKVTSSLGSAEKELGAEVTNRLYALTCVIGAVQDSLFQVDSDLLPEVAALQELGIVTTAQELRTGIPAERLIQRAHPVLANMLAVSA